jgi:hypothetical protein
MATLRSFAVNCLRAAGLREMSSLAVLYPFVWSVEFDWAAGSGEFAGGMA